MERSESSTTRSTFPIIAITTALSALPLLDLVTGGFFLAHWPLGYFLSMNLALIGTAVLVKRRFLSSTGQVQEAITLITLTLAQIVLIETALGLIGCLTASYTAVTCTLLFWLALVLGRGHHDGDHQPPGPKAVAGLDCLRHILADRWMVFYGATALFAALEVLYSGWLRPPSTGDALTYHLTFVAEWYQKANLSTPHFNRFLYFHVAVMTVLAAYGWAFAPKRPRLLWGVGLLVRKSLVSPARWLTRLSRRARLLLQPWPLLSVLTLSILALTMVSNRFIGLYQSRKYDRWLRLDEGGTAYAWQWIEAETLDHPATIAYAGDNKPYPLYGRRFANRVLYVPPDEREPFFDFGYPMVRDPQPLIYESWLEKMGTWEVEKREALPIRVKSAILLLKVRRTFESASHLSK